MHLHTYHGIAVSGQRHGLLPLTQHSLLVLPEHAHADVRWQAEQGVVSSDLWMAKFVATA